MYKNVLLTTKELSILSEIVEQNLKNYDPKDQTNLLIILRLLERSIVNQNEYVPN